MNLESRTPCSQPAFCLPHMPHGSLLGAPSQGPVPRAHTQLGWPWQSARRRAHGVEVRCPASVVH